MESENEHKAASSRFLRLGWTIAVIAVFLASAGFVFAHQVRLRDQANQLETTSSAGPARFS